MYRTYFSEKNKTAETTGQREHASI